MCRTKDVIRKTEMIKKVKHYKYSLVNLTRTSKANHHKSFFKEINLNLFEIIERDS